MLEIRSFMVLMSVIVAFDCLTLKWYVHYHCQILAKIIIINREFSLAIRSEPIAVTDV